MSYISLGWLELPITRVKKGPGEPISVAELKAAGQKPANVRQLVAQECIVSAEDWALVEQALAWIEDDEEEALLAGYIGLDETKDQRYLMRELVRRLREWQGAGIGPRGSEVRSCTSQP